MGTPYKDISGVVLAGGKSRRMGRDKRFLEVGGQPLLERVCAVLSPLFPEIIVSVAEPTPDLDRLRCRIVVDEIPNCAALGGLYTSLSSASYPKVFAVACDMPFVSEASIRNFIELSEGYDVVVAELATGLQPLHAVYSKACLPFMMRMIKDNNLRLQALTQTAGLKVKILKENELGSLPEQLLPFLNINTPMDLELARKLSDKLGSGMPAGSLD